MANERYALRLFTENKALGCNPYEGNAMLNVFLPCHAPAKNNKEVNYKVGKFATNICMDRDILFWIYPDWIILLKYPMTKRYRS